MRAFLMTAILAMTPVSGFAQDWNCSKPDALPQQGMNHCARLDWQAADRQLNTAYKAARAAMKQMDSYQPDDLKGAANTLRDAQRAWITFRDKACETEGFLFRGGSMEPLIVFTCMTKLTEQRTQDLQFLAEQ